MTNIPYTGTIVGVNTIFYCSKTDAGARSIAPVQRIGGTDYDGTTVVLAEGFLNQVAELRETSPATAVAYTPTEVNGWEIGPKVIA